MNYAKMEIEMMEREIDLPEIPEDFPVKGNRRETRRYSNAEHIRKRYGNAHSEEGKRAAIIAHRAARQNRLAWAAKKGDLAYDTGR